MHHPSRPPLPPHTWLPLSRSKGCNRHASTTAPPHTSTQVAATYEGALEASAQAALAGLVVTIICNLIMAS